MTKNTPLGPMTEKSHDPTTKAASTLSRIAYAISLIGAFGFILGISVLIFAGGESGIITAGLYGGGLAATTGLLMITLQSCTMLIIREMWEIHHQSRSPSDRS